MNLQNQMVSTQPMRLRWFDPISKQFSSAGVAFFNDGYGDYTLKINLLPGEKIYLRPATFEDQQTRLRVERLIKTNGVIHKETVGYGIMSETTKGEIHVRINGYANDLILG